MLLFAGDEEATKEGLEWLLPISKPDLRSRDAATEDETAAEAAEAEEEDEG
jgi:hypothetical protein